MEKRISKIMNTINYTFKDSSLLEHALYHTSYINEHQLAKNQSNERLEFLGDAVLELVTSDYLYEKYPDLPEGNLTKERAAIVCEPALAYCAKQIELGECLFLGKGEEATGGRCRDSVTSDAFEALIGAIYLDGGLSSAKEFIDHFVLDDLNTKRLFYDSKTILQEIVQSNFKESPVYILVHEEGPDHDKSFSVEVRITGRLYGTGTGRTKKAAEQKAAYETIMLLKKQQIE